MLLKNQFVISYFVLFVIKNLKQAGSGTGLAMQWVKFGKFIFI